MLFHSFNKYYICFPQGDVGNASKMNLVLQLMTGVCLAGLAEGMALADRAGLQQKDVMEILTLTNLNCPLIYEKGNGKYCVANVFTEGFNQLL